MISWLYILIASVFEICWIYSLKYMELKKLIKIGFVRVFTEMESFLLLIPVLLYVLFGLGNIVFFSKAMRDIPASTAFAVWMAIALIGVKIVDVVVLKEALSSTNIIFMTLILVGIVGLKMSS
jgi:quaternary ammonium compound-resistance protein SugE